ncbi:hypothetical protein [Amycolatopsis cihanbeyliensis]|uniref:Uncharacterized protein n=1 Tax=Amycolatopsis cihanbeyliensis TaxID=1128664 RepID=A0A542DJS8_AMYCI|nr:hypothetical protein [Amycolatopsis cihanbeyliensis]TQJ03343.1 hypothetical protein FB471_3099 [Amycolatopsis cihanbeyliensis]
MSTPEESDDQRRADGLPPAPRLPGDAPKEVNPPRVVNISFGLWVGSGLSMVAGYVLTLVSKDQIIEQLLEQTRDDRITPADMASGTTTFLWAVLVGSIAFAALFVLFAYKAREGTRSARSVLTVLAVVTMLFQFVLFGHVIFATLSTLLAVAALVLMYLPSVAYYFPKLPRSPLR